MAILKRRNIREAAIQFLYLADLEDGPEATNMQEAFWQMLQESSLKKLNLSKSQGHPPRCAGARWAHTQAQPTGIGHSA